MNKTQKIYSSLSVVSLIMIFFLPAAVLAPFVAQYLSEPSNPGLSLFYLAEGFAFFALAFILLAFMYKEENATKPVSPIVIFITGLAVIYAGYAKLLCDLNETNFFVYLAGIMLVFLTLFEKLKKVNPHTP